MQKLNLMFGATVFTLDKHCGQLLKVAVDPATQKVSDLILEDGWLFKRFPVVPITDVTDTFANNVHLKVNNEQVKTYREYREATIERGAPEWPSAKAVGEVDYMVMPATDVPNLALAREKVRFGVPDEFVILDSDTRVNGLEEHLGSLSHVIVHAEDHLISDLVITRGSLFAKYYIIPIGLVDWLTESEIHTAVTKEELDRLPEYSLSRP